MSDRSASRGILYVYWGTIDQIELSNSIASAKRLGLPVEVRNISSEGSGGLAQKAKMYNLSPFDETLFLDTDTIVFEDISFGFDAARKHGIAMALAPACYVSRGYLPLDANYPEYNTGVIFFVKNEVNKELFSKWEELAPNYPGNDQTSFSMAAIELGVSPYVLPQNWNLRAHLGIAPVFGPIKVWHTRMAVPINIEDWNHSKPYSFGRIVNDGRNVRVLKMNEPTGAAAPVARLKSVIKGLFG